jgi:predicted ATPase
MRVSDPAAYPFCLPFLTKDFELEFDRAVTIIVGENGTALNASIQGPSNSIVQDCDSGRACL